MRHTIEWQFLRFDELTTQELYSMLQLRNEVFVVEQACVFQDMDGADQIAMHLIGKIDSVIAAYARCFGAGVKFAEASIGRVVTRHTVRGDGVGHALIRKAIDCVGQCWGVQAIRIGAQAHLANFYMQHGFVDAGMPYIEDGIEHLEMLRPEPPVVTGNNP